MACKFHRFREYLIDKVNKIVKKDCESLIIVDSHHWLGLARVFSDAYSKFYSDQKYKYLFEIAGVMCEENILTCAGIYKKTLDIEYKNFNNIVSGFIKANFNAIEDSGKYSNVFKCVCIGYNDNVIVDCDGSGACLAECDSCVCETENCSCEHKEHDKICKVDCPHACEPLLCSNSPACKAVVPKWVCDMNDGICFDCKYKYGKCTFLDEAAECPICFEDKACITIFCGHNMCFECWKKTSDATKQDNELDTWDNSPQCPFCRKTLW